MKSPIRFLPVLALTVCLGGCMIEPQGSSVTYPPAEPDVQVDVVTEADVTPVVVTEYYFVGGRYYYWHPGVNHYVVLRDRPPRGYPIRRMERLEAHERAIHSTPPPQHHATGPRIVKPQDKEKHPTKPVPKKKTEQPK